MESGETYEQTFIRELKEELNLDAAECAPKLLGYLTPHTHGVHAFMKVWEIRRDAAPDYNPDDFTEYFWLRPEEVLARIAAGEKAKSDLSKLIEIFYPALAHKGGAYGGQRR